MILQEKGHSLVVGKVVHVRFLPKRYHFSIPFYWPLFDYDILVGAKDFFLPVRYQGFWPWSFWDSDHLKFHRGDLRSQLATFLKSCGDVRPLERILILAQPRMLGYVFNPVSFFFIERSGGEWTTVIQIGNTFNEIKPYYAGNFIADKHNNLSLRFETIKEFYISPFLALTNSMVFHIDVGSDHLKIHVEDFSADEKKQLELTANFSGKAIPLTWGNWLLMQVFVPWQTFIIIFLIHWHAFILWMKRIPYYQKKDVKQYESGVLKWKLSKRSRMNLPKA
jgi:DUF1365 family protein